MPPRLIVLAALAVFAISSLGLTLWIHRRSRRRQLAIGRVLDAADALEERLRVARSELESVASDAENPVLGALHQLLRQRLWLQEHAQSASLQTLQRVQDALETARGRIDAQLREIDRARAEAGE